MLLTIWLYPIPIGILEQIHPLIFERNYVVQVKWWMFLEIRKERPYNCIRIEIDKRFKINSHQSLLRHLHCSCIYQKIWHQHIFWMWFYFPKKIELGQQKPIFGFLPPIYQGYKNLMLIWNLTNKKVIQKIYHDRPKGILLASHWPSQPFYPKLKEFSAMPIAISS